jgi:tRNA dimethylallyltransferase
MDSARLAIGETDAMPVVLVGPTAVGKSSLAIALAQRYRESGRPAEVVSADSMLVYRGMDIGTAKPTLSERETVVHHLIDIFDVSRSATVAEFQAMSRRVIADCEARGVVPIVVGGSALYIRAIVDDFKFPGTDSDVRGRWEAALGVLGPEGLHRRLADLDPEAAAQLLPGNSRRVVRALEVIELTGRPYTAQLPAHRYVLAGVVQIGLDIDRPSLDVRIEQRVEAMWRAGLVAEVRALIGRGLRQGLTASRALGYRQVLSFLDGEITEEQAYQQTVTGTRKFARRQDAWFRKDPRISWLRYDHPGLLAATYAIAGPDGTGRRSGMED